MKRKINLLIVILSLLWSCIYGQEYRILENRNGLDRLTPENGTEKAVTIKVVYDNYIKVPGLKKDWGFSVVIEGLEKTILFDTGTKADIFEHNFKTMGLRAEDIDILFFSHEHGDHTQGVSAFVKMKTGIPVILPEAFSEGFKTQMKDLGLEPVLVVGPSMICDNLYTSGVFDYSIVEQSLVINTPDGLVVITGCAHPGIVNMLGKIKADFGKDIYMVMGGFHLMMKSAEKTDAVIAGIKDLGVKKCGATHCTGDSQIKMFREAFGDDYLELGAGNIIVIN